MFLKMVIAVMQKGGKMAKVEIPIQVNLPEDWIEQVVERLRNDPEAEWAEVIRCKNCKHWREHKYTPYCGFNVIYTKADDFCSRAERREE